MMRYYRDATVEHKSARRKVIHRLPATGINKCTCMNNFLVIRPVNDHFREGLDYRKLRVPDRSSRIDEEVAPSVANWAKRRQVQMKSQTLESFDYISLSIFCLHLNCRNDVHQGPVLWLLHLFMMHQLQLHTTPALRIARGGTGVRRKGHYFIL